MKLIVSFILIVGILLNILVLLGIIRLQKKNLPQKILIFFWLFVLINILHSYTALHNLRYFNRITFVFEDGSRFILAPLIYLYFKSLFINQTHFIKRTSIHFIPFLIYFFGYTIPRLVNILIEPDFFTYLYNIYKYVNMALVKDLFFIFYCVLSLRIFHRVKNTMKHHYSNIKEQDFTWLKIFIVSISAVIVVDLIITLSEIFFSYNVLWDDFITLIFLITAMMYLGYNGMRQSTIFLPYFLFEKNHNSNYTLSKSSESNTLKIKIEETLEHKKIYLNPDLTLRLLAKEIDLSDRKLSAFLNNEMQVSFYDLINSYRIIEAKRRLISDDYLKYSIEGIGFSCGFNSRSTFFKIFKKETGTSPAFYKKAQLK